MRPLNTRPWPGLCADAIKENLGIEVEVAEHGMQELHGELNDKPKKIQFGLISYGMDYLDASNMLGVFRSGGRHNWNNAEFDKLVNEASSMTGDPAERTKMFQDAEKILVDDVGAVFAYHETPGDMIKPYLKGPALEPDANGVAAWHWPGFSGFSNLLQGMYITQRCEQLSLDTAAVVTRCVLRVARGTELRSQATRTLDSSCNTQGISCAIHAGPADRHRDRLVHREHRRLSDDARHTGRAV